MRERTHSEWMSRIEVERIELQMERENCERDIDEKAKQKIDSIKE